MPTIEKDKVAKIHYKLTNDQGDVVDSSEGREPLCYLHGHGNIVVGLEEALTGQAVGAELNVTVSPEHGYGARDDRAVQTVPRGAFPPDAPLSFQARDEAGRPLMGTITKLAGDDVTVDFNHPLAGQTLHFEVSITEVRTATEEEISHGHVHGPGGHHH
ncbi:MAG: FKBP-type peptidyl-prolyl cis-trans isomerase [Planctomycetota bacterium]